VTGDDGALLGELDKGGALSRPVTSTTTSGVATPSFIGSTRFVPPAKNIAVGVDATAETASVTDAALT